MNTVSHEQFDRLVQSASNIRPRTKRELRFAASTASIAPDQWSELELVPIADRTKAKGVLLLQPYDKLFILPYELLGGSSDVTGRMKPIICDFCKTWQNGSNSARITFPRGARSNNSVSFLCCADLACSSHVRTKTASSIQSRAQLRESLTNEQRVERLKERLQLLIGDMNFEQ